MTEEKIDLSNLTAATCEEVPEALFVDFLYSSVEEGFDVLEKVREVLAEAKENDEPSMEYLAQVLGVVAMFTAGVSELSEMLKKRITLMSDPQFSDKMTKTAHDLVQLFRYQQAVGHDAVAWAEPHAERLGKSHHAE